MDPTSGAKAIMDRSTALLQREASGIVAYLRRRRDGDEEARDLLVKLLRAFGGEVEALRSLARNVELENLAIPERPMQKQQATAALIAAGERFYRTNLIDEEDTVPSMSWPTTRMLLEEIGSEHVDVLYLRSLRHDFGHLVRGAFAPERGDLEHVHGILAVGDQLLAAVASCARAISNREALRQSAPNWTGRAPASTTER